MKVKDFLKKVNYACAKVPVYLQNGISGTPRKADSTDYADYYYDEKERTVTSISLAPDKITVYYK